MAEGDDLEALRALNDRLQSDLDDALDQIEELEQYTGMGEARQTLEQAQDDVQQLTEKRQELEIQVEELEREHAGCGGNLELREKELREMKEQRDLELYNNTALKRQLEKVLADLDKEKARTADLADAQRRANLGKAEAGGELQKLKQENDQLRAIIGERDEDLKVYQEAVAELKGELEDANEEIEELEGMLRSSKRKVEEGDNDIKDRDKTLVDLQTTLNERVGELRTKDLLLVEADERARAESVRSASQVSALEGKIRSLNTEIRGLKDSTRVKEVEDENTAMKGSLAALTLQRAELIQQLDENNALLAGYQAELAGVEGEREAAVKEAVAEERAKWREVAASQEAAAAALREERARLEETGAVKAEIEALLEEARGRLLEYERGYDIEDAVREQAALRDALRRRDADIARLTGAAGRQMDAYDLLSEVARRLAIELGKGDNVDVLHLYPELEVRAGVSSNLERLRALSHELQQQNDVLEEQRIKLLRQLRVHAEQIGSGSGGLKYMGLSGEELMVVNEFAENLRDGKVTLPVSDRTLELQVKNRALEAKLEELHNELARERDEARAIAAASAAGATSPPSSAALATATGSHPPSSSEGVDQEGGVEGGGGSSSSRSTAKQLAQLRDAMGELTEENRRMREMLEGGGGYHPPTSGLGAGAALEDGDINDPGYLRGRVKALEESLEATRTELAALRGEMGMNGAGAPSKPLPRTPAGMRLLALHRAAAEGAEASKSPADWAQEVRDVRGALVEALEELLTMEAAEEAGKEALDTLSAKLGAMTAQHVALYRAHGEERGRWEEREAASDSKIAELEGSLGVVTAKANKFDELVGALGGGSGSGTSGSSTSTSSSTPVDAAEVIAFLGSVSGGGEGEAGSSSTTTLGPLALARLIAYTKSTTRALMEANLNLPALQRRCEVLGAELAGARAAAHTCELSATEAEAHMRSRILYLELWKKGAETRLERLQVCMDEWVPGGEAGANVSELIELRARLAEALASGAALRMQYLELRELPMRLSKCEAALVERDGELVNIRAALAAAQASAGDSKAVLALLAGEGGNSSSSSTATAASGSASATSSSSATLLANATKRELIAALTITRNSAQEGEVNLAAARRAAELYSLRSQELEVALESYSSRCMEMEGVIEALKAASLATPPAPAPASSSSASTSAASSTSAAAPSSSSSSSSSSSPTLPSQAQFTALREERDALALELHKAKGSADIASEALTTLVGISKDRELEIATLREHVLQLASRSDDDALIGRLQANLLSLKASFHGFLRKHEAQRNALRRSRLAATALETVVDQRSGEVVAVREAGRIKELALQRLCDELRGKLRGLEGGGVTLGQATHFSEAVRRLGATVDRQEEELKGARGAAHESEGAVLGLRAEVASLRAEIEDVARSASGVEGRSAVRRMAEIHEQLRGAILEGLRARRDLILAHDDAKHAQHRCTEYEAMTRLLEERLVASESEHRKREDEHRVALKALAGSARDAAAAAAAAGSGAGAASTSSPGDLTLEAKLGAMDAALREERAVAAAARTAASRAVERARRRRRRVDFLEKQLSIQGVDVASLRVGFEDDDKEEEEEEDAEVGVEVGGNALLVPRKKSSPAASAATTTTTTTTAAAASQELQDTLAAAQATTASLTALIATKNATIAEYQAQLTSLTLAREADTALAAQERTRLVEAAHAESATTIAKLKAAAAGVSAAEPSTMASTIASAQLAERADALERSLAERDRRVRDLEGQLQTALSQVSAMEASLAATSAGNSEGAAALASAAYGPQLAEARARAEEAERKLKSEVGSRERKLRTLAASFAALKEEFVRAEEEHAGALAQAQAQIRSSSRPGKGGGGGGGGESKESGGSSTASRPPLPPPAPPALSLEAAEAQAAEAAALQETLTHMKTQVTRMAREVASLKAAQASSEAEKDSLAKELERTRATLSGLRNGAVVAESEVGILRQELIKAQRERQSLSHAASSHAPATTTTTAVSLSEQQLITALQRRVSVLEAQNDALLSAKVEQEQESVGGGAAHSSSSSLALSASAAMATTLASIPPPPPLGTDASAEWEAGRKLRKRIDDLQAKLTKRTKEAEDATASSTAADAALARAKSDLEALSKRFLALQKRQSSMDSATVDALAEVESVGGLKARLFAAEEALAGVEGERGRESVAIAQLKAALEGERLRSQALITEAEDARVRLAAMQSLAGGGGGGGGDGGALRREEDRYLAENALRARLAEARRAAASLEGAVLAKDASIMELKFEVETARQAGERLRQRLGEVQALNALSVRGKALVAGKEGGVHPPLPPSSSSSSSSSGPGQRTRREAELEDLVVALRRVTEKQRVDLEKARKGQVLPPPLPSSSSSSSSSSTTGNPDPGGAEDASIQVLKVQAATAWSEVTKLKHKLVALESASGPGSAAQASATAETLRRALKVAESEIKTLRTRATTASVDASIVSNLREAREAAESEAKALRGGYSDLERRLDDAEMRAARAEGKVKELEDAAAAPLKVYDLASGKNVTKKVDAVAVAFAEKRESLSISQVEPLVPASDTYAGVSARVQALEKENTALRQELEAFDLEFFEEIEDLKFKYAEAAKKCTAFDQYLAREKAKAGGVLGSKKDPAVAPLTKEGQ